MSDKPQLVVVAQIAGAFGVKGEVKVRSYTAEPDACFAYGPLLNEQGEIVLTPTRTRPLKDLFGVIAKEPLQREGWEALKGTLLYVPRDALPKTDDEDGEFYVIDLIGCDVVHADGRRIGRIKDVPDFGAGDLLEIVPDGGGPSFYLPFDDANTPSVDLAAKLVTVAHEEELLPETLQRQADDGGTN